MKKTVSIICVVLVLALTLSLAACGGSSDSSEPNGSAVGDTFAYSGRTITLSKISEDLGRPFADAGDPAGKWVVFSFAVSDGDSSFSIVPDGFAVNGTAAVNAAAEFSNGAIAKAGSSLKTTEGMTFSLLFDVDRDAALDRLSLTVK